MREKSVDEGGFHGRLFAAFSGSLGAFSRTHAPHAINLRFTDDFYGWLNERNECNF